ncbi:MAG: YfiR family protein [Melioribacteraceae bacterium]|nr:YfiR family protein [Melioribacteraceae bacterium]
MQLPAKIYFILFILLYPYLLNSQMNDGAKVENVMAVYIYNFTKFLEWPQNESENFYIYVLGNNPLTEPLEVIAEKEKILNKSIIVSEITEIEKITPGSIVFIDSKFQSKSNDISALASEKNILTVSSFNDAVEKGMCINFVLDDKKLRFEINLKALENAGIKPNSKLLSLAVKVFN